VNWRPCLQTGRTSLAAAIISLFVIVPASFAKELTPEEQLNIDIDHGRITNIRVIESSGDPKLDANTVRWMTTNWAFAKNRTGLFQLAVVFNKKE
jgi:hypothetical protein